MSSTAVRFDWRPSPVLRLGATGVDAVFLCDKAFEQQARGLMEKADASVDVRVISAGKVRRYASDFPTTQLACLPGVLANMALLARHAAIMAESPVADEK